MPDHDDAGRAERLAHELADCRQRGIEGLDRSTHNQKPVPCPELDRLAAEYTRLRQTQWQGRVAQIKGLLRDALAAYQRREPDDALLIKNLFFGADGGRARVRQPPTKLLQAAQDAYGEPSDSRFREIRTITFRNFAEFLVGFVDTVRTATAAHDASAQDHQGNAAAAPSHASAAHRLVPSKLEAVLRFSYTDPGDTDAVTIDEHQRIIDEYGRCWWGWFKADHDDDHRPVMAERLRNREVGLWERAEGLFYVAHCDGAVVAGDGPIESPDRNLTPAYYRDQPYPAWLDLTSIRRSDYEEFVQRFGEMPSTTQATVHWDPQPTPAPLVVAARGRCILHLADLRFGHHHRWRTAAAPRRNFITAEQAIAQALLLHDIDLAAVGVVIICGNFVSGDPTEGAYGEALAFIDGLCAQLPNVGREHVVIVPGSDDFVRPGDRQRSHQGLYRKFYEDLYGGRDVDLIRLRRYEFPGFRVNVLPVNSVKMLGVDERDDGFFGYGYDAHLNLMLDDYLRHYLQAPASPRVVNVVAAHHHLIPTPVELPGNPQIPIQARIMLGIHDAGSVLDKLSDHRVALFLHGHLHQARYRIVTSDSGWQTAVCGAGTAGASESWLREEFRDGHQNSLALYDIQEGGICGRMIVYNQAFRRDPPVSFQIRDQPSRMNE